MVQVATQLHFATEKFSVDWRDVPADAYEALQVLTAEKNLFEAEEAKRQQEEIEQQRGKSPSY